MTLRMLIDARHREETRVAVVKGNRIEEFDFESAEHKQLKGNIYLAKVTRVEPSLQAAFVDYGGNRHGFLAFSEIHPDYYQIPREDREALLREEAEHAAEEAALRAEEDDDAIEGDAYDAAPSDVDQDHHDDDHHDDEQGEEGGESASADGEAPAGGSPRRGGGRRGDSEADELRRKRMALRRRYKIQDVIHRRQVLLVQVVKEERGNKGAALTTYLSLAGRYCVLMPNTSHGGGISRKISNAADRKRLKTIIAEMNLPSTMGCIVRTAGLQRTKPEIRRDFDYLARLWDEIREKTLRASAPELIHNDSDLIKRAIRDIYNKDIEEVIIEGEEGYRAAKDFMKLLMPSHARRVKQYADAVSLFQRFGTEDQLAAMYHPVVQLKSGGYLVINPTEALVSIDINSGRSTREHGIEQTAVATNLEAAREIARQLRLRDMAGLVVIDFIDMEVNGNVRKVEKAMKDALKDDRARIQVGRISGFGLMEMSRQRLRTGVLEASTRECPHCEGTGLVRTASSAGLSALRMLEEEAARGRGSLITLRASQEAAFYVLNNKRRELDEIETRYGVRIAILSDGETEGARMSVEAAGPRPTQVVSYEPLALAEDDDDLPLEELEEEEEYEAEAADERPARAERSERSDRGGDREAGEDSDGQRKRRRRRRSRRGGRREDGSFAPEGEGGTEEAEAAEENEGGLVLEEGVADSQAPSAEESAEEGARRSRRGRRGGRRRRGGSAEGEAPAGADDTVEASDEPVAQAEPEVVAEAPAIEPEVAAEAEVEVVKPKRRSRRKVADVVEAEVAEPAPEVAAEPIAEVVAEAEAIAEEAPVPKKRASRRKKGEEVAAETPATETMVELTTETAPEVAPLESAAVAGDVATAEEESEPDGEPRRGWWQRTFGN